MALTTTVPTFGGQTIAETFRNVQANLEFAAQPAAGFYGAGQAPSLERIVAQVADLHGVTYQAALRALTGGAG